MANLNEVRLIGRLTRDTELRSTPSGTQIASFGLAVGKKYKGHDGTMVEETTFIDITCFGKLADIANKYLNKGKLVYIGGRLKFDRWEDKNTGQKRSKLSVIANDIQFLEYKEKKITERNTEFQNQDIPF